MKPKIILYLALVLNFLLTGCATDRQPHLAGRWQVLGTDNIVTLTKTDHSARLTSGGKTIVGSYRGLAPDLVKLTFPGNSPQSAERTIVYNVPLDNQQGRTLKVDVDTESKLP